MVNLASGMVSDQQLILRAKSGSGSASSSPERSLSEKGGKMPPFQKLRRKLSPKSSGSNRSGAIDIKQISIKEEDSEQLRQVFDYFDENGDGRISPVELHSCIVSLGGEMSVEEAEIAVKVSDLDGDGLLGFEEFEKLMEWGGEEERNKSLKEAFGMYVIEGKECITETSLRKMLSRLGESRTIEDCRKMIKAFDLNGDGVLSFDEFRVMMR